VIAWDVDHRPLAAQTSFGAQHITTEVVYPREGLAITARDSTFVFGNFKYQPRDGEDREKSALSGRMQVTINGVPARLYPNNTYLAMVPVKPGNFTFRAIARLITESGAAADSTTLDRNVYIPYYLTTSPSDTLVADTSYVYPNVDLEMSPGDILGVALKATPGCSARFSIEGVASDLPMTEQPPMKNFYWGEAVFGQARPPATPEVGGIYTGAYVIRPQDAADKAAIRLEIADTLGNHMDVVAPGKLTIVTPTVPRIASLIQELTVGRTGPGRGYQLFLPAGVKLWITGREGNFYRARLTETESVWVPASGVEFLPPGTLPPQSIIQVVRTTGFENHTRVTIFLSQRLPYKIAQERQPERLQVILYGVTADTDWIRHDFGDPLIGEISWAQESEGRYRLAIDLNQKQQWGYRAFYEDTNLILEVKKSPVRSGLRDLLICVDPGHGPDLGAIGPTGLAEREATYELAEVVAKKLKDKDCRVILTRQATQGILLAARTKLAEVAGADIFISLHYNALPDGVNPYKNRGSSTYYFHPQSYPLAQSIQKRLLKKLKLPNFGLYYDNLSVCRITSMPSVLIEPAFIMHPEEEALILDSDFREKTAEAIVDGIEDFVKAK
jgi:N-acetylmuramoyl-L-alanine amidase